MARTVLSKTSIAGGSSVGVGFTAFTWSAADTGNFNSFTATGKEILVYRNVNADSPLVAHKITIHKTAGQIEYSVAGGSYGTTGQLPTTGWKQTGDSSIWVDADSTEIQFAVLVLP